MSPRDKFDRFMADVRNGTNFKLARLSHAHYRALFSAVLPIAARSEIRGAFMVNGQPATEEDMRIMSPVLTTKECRGALKAFRVMGLLEHDEELGAEWVHDFEEWNPEPRVDRTGAERQRRYRSRMRDRGISRTIPSAVKDAVIERDKAVCVVCGSSKQIEFHHRVPVAEGGDHGIDNIELRCFNCHRGNAGHAVTSRNGTTSRDGDVTPTEVEVEVKPPTPFAVDLEEWLLHYEQTTGHKLPGRGTKAFHSIAESYNARRLEGHAAEDVRDAIDGAHFDEFRRLNGYDTADSILRPTKIGSLIARGRRHRLTHPVAPGEDRAARFASYQGTLK